jgi:hypothetical protein
LKINEDINKKNVHSFNNREIIEYIILQPEKFINNRELKYFLGKHVENKILNSKIKIK